ncbi:MAG TPA: SDR family NAD(P)-dependent oxidoreductase [Candidatus Binatia bacterium]|nr:SDR family NAD(P)-dependent oxidoreductase [Candidatus Binatia bacterium]
MITRFRDRVVIVTGAARGIGADIARAFAGEGARLAILDVDAGGLYTVGGALRAAGADVLDLVTDVTRGAEVDGAVASVLERWSRVDVLVNNAGGFAVIRPTEEISEEEWNAIVALNLTSVFLCSRAVLPAMRRQRAGRIVNVASVVGRGGAVRVTSHYAAAKAGVIGFTRHLALEAGPDGITVNAVAPGTTATERVLKARTPAETRRVAEAIPLRRLGEPREIARTVLFLASDDASFVNGATLDVNGGQLMA